MRYEFRYRLKPNTRVYLVEKWSTLKKTMISEHICNSIGNSKIEYVPTKDDDIVFQLIGNDRIVIDRLVIIRDTLKTVFSNHMDYKCLLCGICFVA